MAGALAERVFADKIEGVGFRDVRVHERRRFALDDVARYPLFTPALVELASEVLAPARQAEIASALTISARKPA